MKKIIVFLGIAAILASAVAAVFIAVFDVNRYKPFIERKLREETGISASIGRVSLRFGCRISLELKDVLIGGGGEAGEGPAVTVEKAGLMIRLMPLLRKSLEIGAVRLVKPQFSLVCGAGGKAEIEGLTFSPPEEQGFSSRAGLRKVSFLIEKVEIEEGDILLKSAVRDAFFEIPFKKLDIEIENISALRPAGFHLRAAFFCGKQNLDMVGSLQFPGPGQAVCLDDVTLKIELDHRGAEELFHAMPVLNRSGLLEAPAGRLEIRSGHLESGENFLEKLSGRILITGGRLYPAGLPTPLENISLDARLRGDTLEVNDFSADVAEGKIRLSGTVEEFPAAPAMDLEVFAEGLRLDSFYSPSMPEDTLFKSHITVAFRGSARGDTWQAVSRTLTGEGRIGFPDAVIVNFNLLREAMRKLTLLPGLVEILLKRLPAVDHITLEARDTVFRPVDFPVTAEMGVISSERVCFATDTLEIAGPARLSLEDDMLFCQGMLKIYPVFADKLIQGMNRLRPLRVADGWLGFPVRIQGKVKHPSLVPDMHYINPRLAVDKTGELIGGLVKKTFDRKGTKESQPPSSYSASQPVPESFAREAAQSGDAI